jgi:uridine kinase
VCIVFQPHPRNPTDCLPSKKAEIPVYSFEKHSRLDKTTTIYSPHVLILEGIFALHDQRVLDLLDLRIFCEADGDLCLSRRIVRDIRERGRDIEGCIKQWFTFVKPNFHKFVEPQRNVAGMCSTFLFSLPLFHDDTTNIVQQNTRVDKQPYIFRSYLISYTQSQTLVVLLNRPMLTIEYRYHRASRHRKQGRH